MVQIIGHRGAKAYEPENTLRSVRRALEMGVDAVEIDVHLSADGVLTVIHDATVDRTTNGNGAVAKMTFTQLRELDAGQGERIPSLWEVVELIRGRARLFIEVKESAAVGPLAEFMRQEELFDAAQVISFWHPAMQELRRREPRITTGVLLVGCPVDAPAVARAAGAQTLMLNFAYVTPELVQAAHAANLRVNVWNIDRVEELLPFLDMGVDGVGSNKPDILVDYLRTQQR